jgi:FkbM family methyltransferase
MHFMLIYGKNKMEHFDKLRSNELKEYCRISYNNKVYNFYIPNGACYWRVSTFKTKEPWTLDWIDTFDSSDVFWDIGANVGLYSLHAAISRNVQVFAFEPESANYKVLNENIRINGLSNLINAYSIAVADSHQFGKLNLSIIETAASGHHFARNSMSSLSQGCISYTMDMLYDMLGPPNHIKIDVDGIESSIIQGGLEKVLPSVKSLLIEININDPSRYNLRDRLIHLGFKWDEEFATRSTVKEGPSKGVGEHLFTR